MKKTRKKILKKLKNKLSANILPHAIYALMRTLYATLRVRYEGIEVIESFYRKDRGFIAAFWHSMIIMASYPYRGKGIHVLVSQHGDGELIGRVIRKFGFHLVRGSSTRGGKQALQELVKLVNQNRDVAITPDGPRGPAEEVKPGVAQLARLTGAPVVVGAFSASRLFVLNTWDRFRIPVPFSSVRFVIGEPIYYREGEDLEDFRKRIELSMKSVTERADAYFRK